MRLIANIRIMTTLSHSLSSNVSRIIYARLLAQEVEGYNSIKNTKSLTKVPTKLYNHVGTIGREGKELLRYAPL